jgi:acyl-CoA-dependent ceramide synthase
MAGSALNANMLIDTGLSINLLSLLGLVHLFFPRARRRTRRFIELQYADQQTGLYERGWDDAYMVLFWIVTFTGLRAAVMDYVLKPFAQWAGIKSSKKIQTRFAEQAWMLLYYVVFWSVGMVSLRIIRPVQESNADLVVFDSTSCTTRHIGST